MCVIEGNGKLLEKDKSSRVTASEDVPYHMKAIHGLTVKLMCVTQLVYYNRVARWTRE